jgi:hypothetical protein
MIIVIARSLPIAERSRSFNSSFNNRELDEQEGTAHQYKTTRLPSAFGEASVYGGRGKREGRIQKTEFRILKVFYSDY